MKLRLTIILSFILLFIRCSIVEQKKNDLMEWKLNGKVKSFRQISYRAIEKYGVISKQEGPSGGIYVLFNEEGNTIEHNIYGLDGSLDWKYTYKYDDKGNKIEENRHYPDGPGGKTTYKYDYKGNMIEENEYTASEKWWSKNTYKYDNEGNIIESGSYYKSDSILYQITIYQYDNEGNLIEENEYDSTGTYVYPYRQKTYKYDDAGNVIEKRYYGFDNNLQPDWIVAKYAYEFDEKNNWIRKTEFVNEIPKYIIEREIEYYK
jgi:hypothetical protein